MGKTSSYATLFIFSLPLLVQAFKHRSRFVHVSEEMSWDEAQKYCRTHHTDLAIFENKREIEALPCGQKKSCWIGLHRDEKTSKIWKWPNGEEVKFESWHKNEPNSDTELCGFLKDEKWYDQSCSYEYEFLCYDDDLILVKEKKTWEEALEHCRTLQTDSASRDDLLYDLPHITAENDNLSTEMLQNVPYHEVWIGLRFLAGHWFWVDGFPLEKWLEQQLPVCPAPWMYCGTMSKKGGFYLRDCSERRRFFCSLSKK